MKFVCATLHMPELVHTALHVHAAKHVYTYRIRVVHIQESRIYH